MAAQQLRLQGRLGDPHMDLNTDPRVHPVLLEASTALGLNNFAPFPELSSNIDELTPVMEQMDTMITTLYEAIPNDLPSDVDEKIAESTVTIKGVDDNDIILYIFKPETATGPLPAVVYFHGGGMVIAPTTSKIHLRWTKSLAATGAIGIAVDYRNAYTKAGRNAFPAGLNDCAAAVKYLFANKQSLGISHIVVQGESGGGNLSIATALKAKKEGWIDQISGVYSCVPYISNVYRWSREQKLKEYPSLVENDGYFINVHQSAALASYYTDEKDNTNPLAWPLHASKEDLKGLPPFKLSMDELDPLRDEGLAFYRKLAAAGVEVAAQVNLGVTHGASLVFRKALPQVHNGAIRDIVAFARSLA